MRTIRSFGSRKPHPELVEGRGFRSRRPDV